jgi:uncharacterized DUF497 family protein
MSSPLVYGFQFDDENCSKIEEHGLSVEQVEQVLGHRHLVVRNRKERRARYLILGRDDVGTCIAVPVEAKADEVIWRPVTAWRCKPAEVSRLEKAGL